MGTTRTHYASAYGRTIAIESSEIDLALPFLPFPWVSEAPSVEIDRRYQVSTLGEERFGLAIDGAEPSERGSARSEMRSRGICIIGWRPIPAVISSFMPVV